MSKETHMNIVAAIMFATGKATSIKSIHMSAQIDESPARLLKDKSTMKVEKGSRKARNQTPSTQKGTKNRMKHFPSASHTYEIMIRITTLASGKNMQRWKKLKLI